MIKTLRITSIFFIVLAIVIFVLPIHYGFRSGEEIKDFLTGPSVIEQFKSTQGTKVNTPNSQVSRLVQEAQAFALYLNPPKPVVTSNPRPNVNSLDTITKIDTKPKFTVIGTSVCNNQPELSMVLIDEPGTGIHWVKQSEQVGHLIIEQIKDGVIVVKSDTETYELTLEKSDNQVSRATVLPSININRSTPNTNNQARTTASTPASRSTNSSASVSAREPTIQRPQRTQVDNSEILEDVLNRIKLYKENPDLTQEEIEKQIELEITNLQATYVGEIEAEALDELGEELKSAFLD